MSVLLFAAVLKQEAHWSHRNRTAAQTETHRHVVATKWKIGVTAVVVGGSSTARHWRWVDKMGRAARLGRQERRSGKDTSKCVANPRMGGQNQAVEACGEKSARGMPHGDSALR